MGHWIRACAVIGCFMMVAVTVHAEGKRFTLAAEETLIDSGFLKYVLPRFSLKTSIRIDLVPLADANEADLLVGPEEVIGTGRAVFQDGKTRYLVKPTGREDGATAHVDRFTKWLRSDTGLRAIIGFMVDGAPVYAAATSTAVVAEPSEITGDVKSGESLSLIHCGRCHVIGPANRMSGIGSTPSFAVLRTLEDWELRFRGFYILKPHGAFTQIDTVTAPFDASRPPPIAPVEITLDDLDAIVAYVASVQPADLGRPIQVQ